jgi:1-pyrroline-5-carboxylate dehydrogenase
MNGRFRVPPPVNEPVLAYAPGSRERRELEAKLTELSASEVEIPLVIGGEEVRTGDTSAVVMPHDHGHLIGRCHQAGPREVARAIEASQEAWQAWSRTRWEDRAAIFLRAAELLATTWRATLNASTMLGQSKTAHQAEIDAACELIDFLRFNVHFAERIYEDQPISSPGVWNRSDYRPLEGFVYAVTPFNFTAIGGNLPTAPAIMGNVVLWKPSSSALHSAHYVMRLLMEAGLPPGVVNFIPGNPVTVTESLIEDPAFSGIHYTGSTSVFQSLWKQMGENISTYRTYPRIVGETGGKDFIVAHPSADPEAVATAMIRGAFEYQGQKCSAASRAYIPEGLWAEIEPGLVRDIDTLTMGDVRDFRNFTGAVISARAFRDISGYLERARSGSDVEVLAGGTFDDAQGWFIRPTLLRAHDPAHETMCEEIFGPVLTVFVYPDQRWTETLGLAERTSPYGLTGAVFARERAALSEADETLRFAAGNFYVNDKPTGAVVGQQPFGGARASGTNDKSGSALNLLRWVSPRSIKEMFVPPTDYRYPFMAE